MVLFQPQYHSPLAAQFWFLGLDARQGSLLKRGFIKTRPQRLQGSSLYRLEGLTLHSSGLWLNLPQGMLYIERRTGWITIGSKRVTQNYGLARVKPHLLAHEAWIIQTYGKQYRTELLKRNRAPTPIRRSLKHWNRWINDESLAAFLWQPPQHMARAVEHWSFDFAGLT